MTKKKLTPEQAHADLVVEYDVQITKFFSRHLYQERWTKKLEMAVLKHAIKNNFKQFLWAYLDYRKSRK